MVHWLDVIHGLGFQFADGDERTVPEQDSARMVGGIAARWLPHMHLAVTAHPFPGLPRRVTA